MADFDFGSEHAMEKADVGTIDRNGASAGVSEAFGEDLIEVVGHLPFELNDSVGGESQTPTDAREVGIGL